MTTPTKTPHTPTPWSSVLFTPLGADSAKIADFCTEHRSSDEDFANLDFVLLAVNNHEKLVEALKAALGELEGWQDGATCFRIRSVLASLSDGQEKEGK